MTAYPFKFTPNPESLKKARVKVNTGYNQDRDYERGIISAYMEAEHEAGRARVSHVSARNNPDKITTTRLIMTLPEGEK